MSQREDGPEALGLDDALLAIAMREAYAATIGEPFVPWTPDTASAWPHADRTIRDRFHSEWTQRMYAASGVNPDHVVGTHHVETPQRTTAEIVKRYEQGAGPREIAATFGLGERQVFRLIRKAGVGPRIVPNRERVKQLHAQGGTDADMAVTLRITRQRVTQLRQALGLEAHEPPRTRQATVMTYLIDQGHSPAAIARRFKMARAKVEEIVAAMRRRAA